MTSLSTLRRVVFRWVGAAAGLLGCALLAHPAGAQTVPLYTLSSSVGTYAPLTTGTSFAPDGGGGSTDDGYSLPITLPFAFQFGTSSFTTVTMVTNGYIGLGSGHTVPGNYNVFRNTAAAEDNVIAFANVDLELVDSIAAYRSEVSGAAPNRIFKIEAAGFQRYSGVGGPGKTGSAQVWLYEGSNDIEIHYGAFGRAWGDDAFQGRFDSVRVGLRGVGVTDLAAVTGQWSAPVQQNSARAAMEMSGPNANLPADGQILRFAFPGGQDLNPPNLGPITLTPPAPACVSAAHVVSIQPTDVSGIASAQLTYAVANGPNITLPMTTTGSVWTATIPAQGSALVSYFVRVTDASPQANVATSPTASYADATLTVDAGPDQTINVGDSVVLRATASQRFSLKISEFVLSGIGRGATQPLPAYAAGADDLVEIANTGQVAANLSGYRFEVRAAGSLIPRSYTFANGVALDSGAVLLLHLGTGTDSPANSFYHTGGVNDVIGSGADVGFLLSAPGGVPVDGVAVNNYVGSTGFPAGVWSGPGVSSALGIAGASLTGTDTNSATGWVVPTDSVRQTIGRYNPGLPREPLPAVTWTGGVLPAPSTANPLVTPEHLTAGTYTYAVNLDQNGCTATDRVTVTVVQPTLPTANFSASATSVTTNDVVAFTDLTTNLPTSWRWTFAPNNVQYIGGTSATSRNPRVRFTRGGCFTVTLVATNSAGSDAEIKTGYVCAQLAYCSANLHTASVRPDYRPDQQRERGGHDAQQPQHRLHRHRWRRLHPLPRNGHHHRHPHRRPDVHADG